MCSKFVTGPVIMGLVKNLPFEGISVLLGNDLTNQICPHGGDQLIVEDTQSVDPPRGASKPVVFSEGTLPFNRQDLIREQGADPTCLTLIYKL